jgi:hypothetical protein
MENMQFFETLENCGKCRDEFITNIEDLCTECPIRKDVEKTKVNLNKKFTLFKSIESVETIKEYIKDKIKEGREKIEKQINWEHRNTDEDAQVRLRPNRISIVVDWVTVVKFYSEQLELIERENSANNLINEFKKDQPRNNEIDTRFFLTTFLDEQVQKGNEYKNLKRLIENRGFFNIKLDTHKVKCYTPELALILTTKSLQAKNLETKEDVTLNRFEYLNSYEQGFIEGEQYFEGNYGVEHNTLISGENFKNNIELLRTEYFQVKTCKYDENEKEGWVFVKATYPIVLTHNEIKEYGYYSGIVSKVDELLKKFNKQFMPNGTVKEISNTFEKFTNDDNTNKDKIIPTLLSNEFDNIDIKDVYNHFKAGLVDKKYLSEVDLITYLNQAFHHEKIPKKKFNFTNVGSNTKIRNIFYRYYKDLNSKPKGKKREYCRLLGEYFIGHTTDNTYNNFSR